MTDLINILKHSPQWLMIYKAEWTYLPWALFNCFGSLESETNPTTQELKTLLNEDPRILVLTFNPKKYYTDNAVDLILEKFTGSGTESIIQKIQKLNNWNTPTEISIKRINPVYGTLREFLNHYRTLLADYNPTHVILDDKINIDGDLIEKEKSYSFTEIKSFYEEIKDLNSLHKVVKFITHQHFLLIPSNQLTADNLMFPYKLTQMSDFQSHLDVVAYREDRVDLEVNYFVSQSGFNRQTVGKHKVYCYNTGLLKIK